MILRVSRALGLAHASVTLENPHYRALTPAKPQLPQFAPLWQAAIGHAERQEWLTRMSGREGMAKEKPPLSMA